MARENDNDLWMVTAIIQEFKLDAVTLALEALPYFGGMTVSDCRGFGQEKVEGGDTAGEAGAPGGTRSGGGVEDFTPKIRLEIAVAGRVRADAILAVIAQTAHTGRRGDGKIFVWKMSDAVRVRTFDVDARAL